jgi:hypothetical protein
MPSQRPWQMSRMNGDHLTYLQRPLCSEMRKHVRGCNSALEAACRRSVQLSYRKLHLTKDKIERNQGDVYRTMIEVDLAKQALRTAKMKSAAAAALQDNPEAGRSSPLPTISADVDAIPLETLTENDNDTAAADGVDVDVAVTNGTLYSVTNGNNIHQASATAAYDANSNKLLRTVDETDTSNIAEVSDNDNWVTGEPKPRLNPLSMKQIHQHIETESKQLSHTVRESGIKIELSTAHDTVIADNSKESSEQNSVNCMKMANNNNNNNNVDESENVNQNVSGNRRIRRSMSDVRTPRTLRANQKLSTVSLPNTGIGAIMEESTITELQLPAIPMPTSSRTPRQSAVSLYNNSNVNSNGTNNSIKQHSFPFSSGKKSSNNTNLSARKLSSNREPLTSKETDSSDVSSYDNDVIQYRMASDGKLVRSTLPYRRQMFFMPPDPAIFDNRKSMLLACEERSRRHSVAKMSAFIRSLSNNGEL